MEVDHQPHPNTAFEKSETLWFEDGSVVIVAEEVGFRVYKGVLSRCSDVFKDTFSMPQRAESSQERFEGCPVVRVQDSARDMERFLEVVFNGAQIWWKLSSQVHDWNALRPVLKLSHKYQAEQHLQQGIQRLTGRFPDKVKEWDALYEANSKRLGPLECVISMANMAKFLDLPGVHRRALYVCCQLDAAILIGGVTLIDGTHEVLSQEDIVVCINARVNLAKESAKLWAERFSFPCPNCIFEDGQCEQLRGELAKRAQETPREISYNPLVPQLVTYRLLSSKLCMNCAQFLIDRDAGLRQEIMDNLETLLGA
ncbi:hypothetical protein EIP91_008135 [Steccherinum ochraceum]|uniref:BTB domain-containing protein n=1 Tax=Steccherinum ochraceum TaxID=92696 RepID=A0A4V2MVG3_9APHY|nr:hypothetical protein EIP91_008135 [Steccherinum ochraceum]